MASRGLVSNGSRRRRVIGLAAATQPTIEKIRLLSDPELHPELQPQSNPELRFSIRVRKLLAFGLPNSLIGIAHLPPSSRLAWAPRKTYRRWFQWPAAMSFWHLLHPLADRAEPLRHPEAGVSVNCMIAWIAMILLFIGVTLFLPRRDPATKAARAFFATLRGFSWAIVVIWHAIVSLRWCSSSSRNVLVFIGD